MMELPSVIQLLLCLAALCLLYFVILNLRRNALRMLFIRTAAVGALILSSMSLVLGYSAFLDGSAPLDLISVALLGVALIVLVILVFSYNRKIRLNVKLLAYGAFGCLLTHILLQGIALSAA